MAPPCSVSPEQIYEALTAKGASTVQAIGIMANMIAESSLNVETGLGGTTIDSNGYPVYGLVSWNAASYPSAAALVTGNCQTDLTAQVTFLAQTGGFAAASGSTGAQAAGNFASGYERCSSCTPGGSSYSQRVANAATIEGYIASGSWPASAGSAAAQAQLTSAASADCLLTFPGIAGVGSFCLFQKSWARAVAGGLMIGIAVPVGLTGAVVLAAFAFRRVAPQAGRMAEGAGAMIAAVPGLEAAGLSVGAAGSAARRSPGQSLGQRRSRIAGEQRAQQQEGRRQQASAQREATRRARTGTTVENQYQRAKKPAVRTRRPA